MSKYALENNIQTTTEPGKLKRYDLCSIRKIIKGLYASKYKPRDKVQVFFNFKGGTGKTSLCFQVSSCLALYGYKILVIDSDPQAHLSYSFGMDERFDLATLFDVIVNKAPIEETIKNVFEGLDIIPANLSLTRLELHINEMPNRERVLTKLLSDLKKDYDFIFIDTNPTISTTNRNATMAADILNIVCETQPYSLKGLEILIQEIGFLSDAMEEEIKYRIIPNKYESKTVTSQEGLGILRTKYTSNVLNSIIRKCEDINVSAKKRTPLMTFCNNRSIAFEDILDLTKEILKKSAIEI